MLFGVFWRAGSWGVEELENQVGELGSFGVGELGSLEITYDLLKITYG